MRISSASYVHSIRCTTVLSAEVSTSRREVIESYICPGQEPASYVAESLLSARRGGERDLAEIDPDVAGNTTTIFYSTAIQRGPYTLQLYR